jgi:hypothetical protein
MIEKLKVLWAEHKWAGVLIFVMAVLLSWFAFKKGGLLRKGRRY